MTGRSRSSETAEVGMVPQAGSLEAAFCDCCITVTRASRRFAEETQGVHTSVNAARRSACATKEHGRKQNWADGGVGRGPGGPPHKSSLAAKKLGSTLL